MRFYFDIQDQDGMQRDEAGLELPDMEAAINEARRALGDLLREELRHPGGDGVSIRIRDGQSPVVISVSLTTELEGPTADPTGQPVTAD